MDVKRTCPRQVVAITTAQSTSISTAEIAPKKVYCQCGQLTHGAAQACTRQSIRQKGQQWTCRRTPEATDTQTALVRAERGGESLREGGL
jgi:hypothetical protein